MGKRKTIQPTASLETVRKMLEDRKKGERYTNPYFANKNPDVPSGFNAIFDDDKWLASQEKIGERNKRFADRKENNREFVSNLEQLSNDLYSNMLAFYNKTKDVDATVKRFEQAKSAIDENVEKLTYKNKIELDPFERVIAKMSLIDDKFLDYLSNNALIKAINIMFTNKDFIEKHNDYIYARLGKDIILLKNKMFKYFPQIIGELDSQKAQNMLAIYPHLYSKVSKSTHQDFVSLKDADGRHVIFSNLIKHNIEIVKYLPEEDLTLALKDYPSSLGRALNLYPEKMLDLKTGIFSIVKPSIVFQSVPKQEMVDNIIKTDEENNTNLFKQITAKHPELAEYFAKFVVEKSVALR